LTEDYFYERLKAEKEKLKSQFKQQIQRLQTERDSLDNLIKKNKQELKFQRVKTKTLSVRVLKSLSTEVDSASRDSIKPLVEDYVASQELNDSLCDSTIYSLETLVANRDSSLSFHRQVEETQNQMLKDQAARNQQLTDQLNIAFKMQKKKSRQNKILAGGIMIISGITTSILIITKSL
jgi:hypothetical protein